MKTLSMNIAIIGTSDTAAVFAAGTAISGHQVFLTRKEGDSTEMSSVLQTFENIHICDIEYASSQADVIIIATPPADVREVAYWMGDVRQKVVIDASANSIAGNETSINTMGAIKAITGSSNVVKVFCTRGFQSLLKPLVKSDKMQLIIVGDCRKAKEVANIVATDVCIKEVVDLGSEQLLPMFDALVSTLHQVKAVAETPSRQPQLAR